MGAHTMTARNVSPADQSLPKPHPGAPSQSWSPAAWVRFEISFSVEGGGFGAGVARVRGRRRLKKGRRAVEMCIFFLLFCWWWWVREGGGSGQWVLWVCFGGDSMGENCWVGVCLVLAADVILFQDKNR